jgi:hypothetical protein
VGTLGLVLQSHPSGAWDGAPGTLEMQIKGYQFLSPHALPPAPTPSDPDFRTLSDVPELP